MSELEPENTSSRDARNEAKKARRKFRHEILKRMRRIAVRRAGLFSTGPQLDAMAKVLTDRYMHSLKHVPTRVAPHLSPFIPPRESEKCPASSSPQ